MTNTEERINKLEIQVNALNTCIELLRRRSEWILAGRLDKDVCQGHELLAQAIVDGAPRPLV
jgi:hypothetical protein